MVASSPKTSSLLAGSSVAQVIAKEFGVAYATTGAALNFGGCVSAVVVAEAVVVVVAVTVPVAVAVVVAVPVAAAVPVACAAAVLVVRTAAVLVAAAPAGVGVEKTPGDR